MKTVGKRWTVAWYVLACIAAIANFALIAHLERVEYDQTTAARVRLIEQAAKQMDKLVRR